VQHHSLAVSNRRSIEAFRMPEPWQSAVEPEEPRFPVVPGLALTPANLRILIVNEDSRSAASLTDVLNDLGYSTTFTASSAHRGLQAASDFSPSVALVDLVLPDMSGFQLAQTLRSHIRSYVRRVPLIAVAERDIFGTDDLARAAGFVACLAKPIPRIELNSLLRKLCR
jgi:CheY-like chemotaxis protein